MMSHDPDDRERTLPGPQAVPGVGRTRRASSLTQIEGPGAPLRHELRGDRIVIGREGDIRVSSARLSRTHACLVRLGAEVTCVDLDSSNGIFLNGLRVHSAVLREGDRLQLGDVVFLFSAGA